MKVSIFGLGYVGTVSMACMARDGHTTIGVDVNEAKVKAIAEGKSTIVEPNLEELLQQGVKDGKITATTDVRDAIARSDISLISVGTPPGEGGGPDLSYVEAVCQHIGKAVAEKGKAHTVVLRSTVPPGTLARCTEILQVAADGVKVTTAFNPEFLREGSAVKDYVEPPYTIIGSEDAAAEAAVRELYAAVDAPVYVVPAAVAEMIKYTANAWHAVKIAFANEIGRVSHGFGVDGRLVMDLITKDTKLNVSPAYLRPGFAYGGSCLPKDLGSIIHYAAEKRVKTPFLNAVPESNKQLIQDAVGAAIDSGAQKVAVLGLAFKPKTDDLRESPAVPLVKQLLGEGREIKIFDAAVNEANLLGANLSFIQLHLPHLNKLLAASAAEAIEDAELVIATYSTPEFKAALDSAAKGTKVLDLAGVYGPGEAPSHLTYQALCW